MTTGTPESLPDPTALSGHSPGSSKAKGQERNRAWVAVDVIAVLDRFADRGGRRNLAWQLSRCVPGTDQLGGWNSWARIARASVLGLGGATDARYRR